MQTTHPSVAPRPDHAPALFRPALTSRGWHDLGIALGLFAALTLVRFAAEHVDPLWFPLLIAYAALPLILIPRANWPRIGLHQGQARWSLVAGIAAAILLKGITIAALFALLGTTEANWMLGVAEALQGIPAQPPAIRGIILFFMVGAPVVEEVFFRMVQSVWRMRFGGASAIVASSLLFAIAHFDKYIWPFSLTGIIARLIPITFYGLVHAWVYEKTKSTYASIISHLAGNGGEALLLILFVLPHLA